MDGTAVAHPSGPRRYRWLGWVAGIAGFGAAQYFARVRYGPHAGAAVHALGMASLGVWLCWRAASGRRPAGSSPTFGLPGGIVALTLAVESAGKAAGMHIPLWWHFLEGGVALTVGIAETRWHLRQLRVLSAEVDALPRAP